MALLDSKQLNPQLTGSFTLSGSLSTEKNTRIVSNITEIIKVTELLEQQKAQYTMDPKSAGQLQNVGQFKLAIGVDITQASAWAMLGRALLNVNEAIYRN